MGFTPRPIYDVAALRLECKTGERGHISRDSHQRRGLHAGLYDSAAPRLECYGITTVALAGVRTPERLVKSIIDRSPFHEHDHRGRSQGRLRSSATSNDSRL